MSLADEPGRLMRGTVRITPEVEPAQLPVPVEAPALPARRRGFGWGTLFWAATAGLVVLGSGLGIIKLIEDLFARSESLGWLGLGFAAAAALALAWAGERHRSIEDTEALFRAITTGPILVRRAAARALAAAAGAWPSAARAASRALA
mgnify:CR=1 FL=1